MNQVILIGRLTRDPELVYTPGNQTAVTHFSIAVDRPGTQGREKQADFIRITTFGKQAENCDRYLHKGKQVAVNGRIQTGSYKNKEGQTVYTTDVIANNVEFLEAASKELQDSHTKHIVIVHRTIKKSCRMALKQLKRIYHSR